MFQKEEKSKKHKHLDWESGLMNMQNWHGDKIKEKSHLYKPAQQGFVAPTELNKKKDNSKK